MRIIKFRQPMYRDGKFDYWHYWGFLPDLTFIGPDSSRDGIAHAHANSQQFTGLFDKSGVEIYEGDKVRFDTGSGPKIATIEYHEYCYNAGFFPDISTNGSCWWEVIGNIHQNPELLEA